MHTSLPDDLKVAICPLLKTISELGNKANLSKTNFYSKWQIKEIVPAPKMVGQYSYAISITSKLKDTISQGNFLVFYSSDWQYPLRVVATLETEVDELMALDPEFYQLPVSWIEEKLSDISLDCTGQSSVKITNDIAGGEYETDYSLSLRVAWSVAEQDLSKHFDRWIELMDLALG